MKAHSVGREAAGSPEVEPAQEAGHGNEIEPVLEKMLAPSNVDYLHIHFAAAGCYAAKVQRA
jgi:hypothetical protein